MDNDDRSVAVAEDELDALNIFLPERNSAAARQLPPVHHSSAAGLSDTDDVVQGHYPVFTADQQRRHRVRLRQPDVVTIDILTTIGTGIARTRASLAGVGVSIGTVRSVRTYAAKGLAGIRARFGELARRPGWSAASFAGGVLVGVLLLQLFGIRDSPPSQSTPELGSDSLPASPSSTPAVATTFVQEFRESGAASPAPAPSPATKPSGPVGTRDYRGGLKIDSQPAGAAVFVNNQRIGQTPIAVASLPAGSRALRLELNGYSPWSRAIRVVANQSTTVAARLEPTR